jgi:ribonucleoside-diphosphate reductase alpha chain
MKKYKYEEVRNASINYFNGDTLAADVFAGKYALQDLDGNLYELTPKDMHNRIASEFARIEQNYPSPLSKQEIFEMLNSWDVVPQGSPMSAIGNPFQVQSLSNCFVIESPYDSYGGILKTDQEQVQIMKRRGGVGIDLSTLRPLGLQVANAARSSDGIGSFMERYSNTTREVAQGGRRGALMLSISCHHPNVLTFVNIKRDTTKVTGANVSVRITDEFMNAVKNDELYEQRFPVEKDAKHQVKNLVSAREVWKNIVQAMRDCSEPGMLFWDRITGYSPADSYASKGFRTVSTNPCGELPLSVADSCRLILVNLKNFVVEPFTENAYFDYNRFSEVAYNSQRLMDDLVDLEIEAVEKIIAKITADPEPEYIKRTELELWNRIKLSAVNGRRTGLGITALGDVFAALNLKYDSDDSVKVTDGIYRTLALSSYYSSVVLASERGTFPAYDYELEKDDKFINHLLSTGGDDLTDRIDLVSLKKMYLKHGRRNISNLTTAPAGSTSILTQTTSGCEPVLFLKARRKRKVNPSDKMASIDEIDKMGDKWQHYDVYHEGVKKWMEITGKSDVTQSPYHGSTVEEINYLQKIKIQAAAQEWLDHSVSNTLNLPSNVTTEEVEEVCMKAWELGCKGVTVYRIGSRDAVISKQSTAHEQTQEIKETIAPKRPKALPCDIQRVTVQGETYLALIGLMNGKPYEVFAGLQEHVLLPKKIKSGSLIKNGKGKDGVVTYNLSIQIDDEELVFKDIVNLFNNQVHGAFTRTISLALRHGTPVQFLCEQLRKDKHSDITSFSSCIARVLKSYVPDGVSSSSEKTCPQCNSSGLVYQQGCVQCNNCGWSKC